MPNLKYKQIWTFKSYLMQQKSPCTNLLIPTFQSPHDVVSHHRTKSSIICQTLQKCLRESEIFPLALFLSINTLAFL